MSVPSTFSPEFTLFCVYQMVRQHPDLLVGHHVADDLNHPFNDFTRRAIRAATGFTIDHKDLIAEALRTGDWTAVEAALFREYPAIRNEPWFGTITQQIGKGEFDCLKDVGPWIPADLAPPTHVPLFENPGFIEQLARQIHVGRLVERYLTPHGMARLLGMKVK